LQAEKKRPRTNEQRPRNLLQNRPLKREEDKQGRDKEREKRGVKGNRRP